MLRARSNSLAAPLRFTITALTIFAGGGYTVSAGAFELRDEPLAIAGERTIAQDEPADENVGEPAPEDAPVEGEPAAGEAPVVPPDEPLDEPPAPADDAPKN